MEKQFILDFVSSEVAKLRNGKYYSIFLEAGHFSPGNIEKSSLRSFESSVDLAKELKYSFGRRVRVLLGVLVDDLGLTCSEGLCSPQGILKHKGLPTEYEQILNDLGLKIPFEVKLSSERNIKNKAINIFKKDLSVLRGNENFKVTGDIGHQGYYLDDIFLGTSSGYKFAIRCPLLMGVHYYLTFLDMNKKLPFSEKFYIFDWSLFSEMAKVNQGRYVFEHLFRSKFISPDKEMLILNTFTNDSHTDAIISDVNGDRVNLHSEFFSQEESVYAGLFGL